MRPTKFILLSKHQENNALLIEKIAKPLVENGFTYEKENPDIIIILGGDGSLLKAVHQYNGRGKFLLLNTGHLGFYSDYSVQEEEGFVHAILKNEAKEERIPLYNVTAGEKSFFFLNDVALQTPETCFMQISVNGTLLTESRNSGIVVSSSIGSTGYLTSLGSPLVLGKPSILQYSLLAPCFNRLFPNSISKAIFPDDMKLTIEIKEGFVTTFIDGRNVHVKGENSFCFTKPDNKYITLLHLKEVNEVDRIRNNITGEK